MDEKGLRKTRKEFSGGGNDMVDLRRGGSNTAVKDNLFHCVLLEMVPKLVQTVFCIPYFMQWLVSTVA